jgi:hypothetical protein
MGRSFESVGMSANGVSAIWLKVSKALKKEDQIYGRKLAEMVEIHSREAFYSFNDLLGRGNIFGAIGADKETEWKGTDRIKHAWMGEPGRRSGAEQNMHRDVQGVPWRSYMPLTVLSGT